MGQRGRIRAFYRLNFGSFSPMKKRLGWLLCLGFPMEGPMPWSEDPDQRGRHVPIVVSERLEPNPKWTAEDGFLFSRIDGHTCWSILREMGGPDPDGVDARLETWLAEGIIEIRAGRAMADGGSAEPEVVPEASRASMEPGFDARIDPELDISSEVQERLIEFEQKSSGPCHELLGVEIAADPRQIKRAYFELSKEFHPDRFFRLNLGQHRERADRVFRKIIEAYEILSNNPNPEVPIANSLPRARVAAGCASASDLPGQGSRIERLRECMPYRVPFEQHRMRRERARNFCEAAKISRGSGRLLEAMVHFQVAIQLDPAHSPYRACLADLKLDLATLEAERCDGETRHGDSAREVGFEGIQEYLWSAVELEPDNARVRIRCAQLWLQIRRYREAGRHACRAVELAPKSAASHAILGRVRHSEGNSASARQAFQRVLELDPNHSEAKNFLASSPERAASPSTGVVNV